MYAAGLRDPAKDPNGILVGQFRGTFNCRDYNGPGDSQANVEVIKTGKGPETVTWKAYHWDRGVKSYTYVPPGKDK